MPDAESFIAAIAANPADDLPRLVFADWLDENGDPTRAEFIRDHVRLAKLRPGTDEYKTLFRKCADTLKANLPAWIKPACDAFGQPTEWKPGKAVGGRFPIIFGPPAGPCLNRLGFSRGLIGTAGVFVGTNCPTGAIDELFRLNPVVQLTLATSQSVIRWDEVASHRMQAVRELQLVPTRFGGSLEKVFNSPVLSGVSELAAHLSTQLEDLCRSSMAKRLIVLRSSPSVQVCRALEAFPLDDKLHEFSARGINPQAMNSTELWSAVSRVSFRPTLKRLDLTRCGMSDDGLAAFARGEEWKRLQGLKLGGNLFGDTGWSDFCHGWRTPELTYLDASRNRLTDAGAEMLARSGMLKTLRVIDLRGNRIAGRGAVALARAVAEGKLQKLLLAGNPVGKREAATVKGLLGGRTDL